MDTKEHRTNKLGATARGSARTCPDRFCITEPIPYRSLIERVQPHLRAGLSSRALGEGGGRARWSGTTVVSALSDLRTGLVHAAMSTLPDDERSPVRGLYELTDGRFANDVRALLPHAADAVAGLRRPGTASARNAAHRTRRLLAAFVSGLSDRSPAQVQAALLSTAWRDVITAARAHNPAVSGSIINGLMHLARAADAAGIKPEAIPVDPHALARTMGELITARTALDSARSALRRLARLSIDGVPSWPPPARRNAALRLAPTAAGHLEVAEAHVPALAALARRYTSLRQSGKLRASKATSYGRERALHRACTIAARAAEAGVIPGNVARSRCLWDWWTVAVPYALDGHLLDDTSIVHDDLLGGSVDDDTASLPALVACLVWGARNGLMPKADTGDDLPRSVLVDAQAVWYAAQDVAAATIQGRKWTAETQAQVARAKAAHVQACARLDAHIGQHLTAKDKAVAMRMATLSIVLALYLPWWTEIELPRLEAELAAVRARIAKLNAQAEPSRRWGPGEHPEERMALAAFEQGLEAWLALAVAVADPLRIKNQWAGRLGLARTEYLLHGGFDGNGSLVRLHRLSSQFGGTQWAEQLGNPHAALKTGKYADRQWDLAAVALSPRWLAAYLERLWLPRLRRHGLVGSTTSLRDALAGQRFPLWVADPDAQRGMEAPPLHPGGFATEHAIRRRFRRGLLAAMRAIGAHELGLVDQPIPDDDDEAARLWPWLLSPHIARLWWVSHCVGVMDDSGLAFRRRTTTGEIQLLDAVQFAQRATTDREATMRKSYDAASDMLRQQCLRASNDWRHPLAAQEDVVDLLCTPDARVDWSAKWEAWASMTRRGEGEMLPPALMRAWERRRAGTDVRPPALRRRAEATSSPVQGRAA